MNCVICDKSGTSFTKVNHQELGVILLCDACLVKEKDRIRTSPHRSGCGCMWK